MNTNVTTVYSIAKLLLTALIATGCASEAAHEEDHPHGPGGEHLPAAPVSPRQGGTVTLHTDSTELYLEHPALVVGELGRFVVHITDATDFKPVTAGTVTFRFVARTHARAIRYPGGRVCRDRRGRSSAPRDALPCSTRTWPRALMTWTRT